MLTSVYWTPFCARTGWYSDRVREPILDFYHTDRAAETEKFSEALKNFPSVEKAGARLLLAIALLEEYSAKNS